MLATLSGQVGEALTERLPAELAALCGTAMGSVSMRQHVPYHM